MPNFGASLYAGTRPAHFSPCTKATATARRATSEMSINVFSPPPGSKCGENQHFSHPTRTQRRTRNYRRISAFKSRRDSDSCQGRLRVVTSGVEGRPFGWPIALADAAGERSLSLRLRGRRGGPKECVSEKVGATSKRRDG